MTDRDPYRRVARIYDRVIEPMNAGLRDVALRVDPPKAGWKVLDIGCGTGTGLARYGQAGCELFGVDVSAAMLDRARKRLGTQADLRLATGEDLPFTDDTFDLVTISLVIHEVPETSRRAVLDEMTRVLRSGGHALIVDYRFGSLRGLRGRLVKALSVAIERIGGHWDGFRSFRRAGGFPGLAASNGIGISTEKIVAGGAMAVYVTEDHR